MNPGDRVRRVTGGQVLARQGWVEGDLAILRDGIESLGGGAAPRPADGVLDAAGAMVVPGFLDLQINGGFGFDLTSAPQSVWALGERLPATGVTAFLPTLVSGPLEGIDRALEVLAAGPPEGYLGARPLGWHLEGPMLSPSRRGAHEARWLRSPGLDVIEGWRPESGVRMVTLAPELDGATPVVEELVARGVVVSIGHSDAAFERAAAAFDSGARAGTHLFNAMSGLHHRAPGVVGAILARDDVVAGLIVDGVHVHPAVVTSTWRLKGPGGVALVTDAVAPMGAGSGGGRLGTSTIEVSGSEVRGPDGTLSGSTLTLDRAVRNVTEFAGAAVEDAIAAATSTPAALAGETRRGRIEPGAIADLVLLDRDLEVAATIVAGRLAYERGTRTPS